MPKIINIDDMKIDHSEDGWTVTTLADAALIGYPAMVARWWTFEPQTTGPMLTRGTADELIYVIRGAGQAIVGDQTFALDDESVLWLEEGESYQFVSGSSGLEILQAYAPGEG